MLPDVLNGTLAPDASLVAGTLRSGYVNVRLTGNDNLLAAPGTLYCKLPTSVTCWFEATEPAAVVRVPDIVSVLVWNVSSHVTPVFTPVHVRGPLVV